MADSGLTIPVLLGSVRPERQAIRAGRMLMDALKAGGHEGVLVDPLELRLPLLERRARHRPGSTHSRRSTVAPTGSSLSAVNTTTAFLRR
jgi:hypothetical protein